MASLEGFDEIRLLIAPGRSLLSLCFSQPYFVSHFHFFFLRLFFFSKVYIVALQIKVSLEMDLDVCFHFVILNLVNVFKKLFFFMILF